MKRSVFLVVLLYLVPCRLSFFGRHSQHAVLIWPRPSIFIYSKCHIKKLKVGKSCETCLTNRTWPISHHITPLVINPLTGGHTDTHILTREPNQLQEIRCARPKAVRIWFNNFRTLVLDLKKLCQDCSI